MFEYETASPEQLIRRAKHGDAKAFSQLYAQIYKELYRFALYMTRHPQDAEDAVSETVIAAFENIKALNKEESFRNWMFTILNNQCKKTMRLARSEREKLTETAAQEIAAQEMAAEPDYAQWHDVRRAFDALDEEERIIVAFSVFGGYRSEEIARMLDRNAATVRSRKSRALEKMRSALN